MAKRSAERGDVDSAEAIIRTSVEGLTDSIPRLPSTEEMAEMTHPELMESTDRFDRQLMEGLVDRQRIMKEDLIPACARTGVEVAFNHAQTIYDQGDKAGARSQLRYARFHADRIDLDIRDRIKEIQRANRDFVPLGWGLIYSLRR